MGERSGTSVATTGAVIKFDDRKLRLIVARAPDLVESVVNKTGFDIVRLAQNRVPVDTGATKNSIRSRTISRFTRRIGPTTLYAIFLEFGTLRMVARPFMVPALEGVRQPFLNALGAIYRRFQ